MWISRAQSTGDTNSIEPVLSSLWISNIVVVQKTSGDITLVMCWSQTSQQRNRPRQISFTDNRQTCIRILPLYCLYSAKLNLQQEYLQMLQSFCKIRELSTGERPYTILKQMEKNGSITFWRKVSKPTFLKRWIFNNPCKTYSKFIGQWNMQQHGNLQHS